MGSRANPKNYKRSTGSQSRKDALRTMIQSSRQNQYTSARRPGYGSTPRTVGALPGGSEMKYFDCQRNATGLTPVVGSWPVGTMFDPDNTVNLGAAAVANPLCLFSPTVGSALNQRIGRKCHIYKIRINGTIITSSQGAQTTADVASKVRLCLVLDKQTNSAQMVANQMFVPTATPDNTIHAFQNPDNFGRFQFLKDKFVVMQNPSLAGQNPAIDQAGLKHMFKWTVVFKKPLTVNFNATNGGTVADVIDNSLHVVCAADATAMAPQLAYYSRVCFKE